MQNLTRLCCKHVLPYQTSFSHESSSVQSEVSPQSAASRAKRPNSKKMQNARGEIHKRREPLNSNHNAPRRKGKLGKPETKIRYQAFKISFALTIAFHAIRNGRRGYKRHKSRVYSGHAKELVSFQMCTRPVWVRKAVVNKKKAFSFIDQQTGA